MSSLRSGEPVLPPSSGGMDDDWQSRRANSAWNTLVLLDFLRAVGLLADPSAGQDISDRLGFELRRSHLADEGYELVRQCHGTWSPAFGQEHTQRHLAQGRRKLARLRARPSLAPPPVM